MKTARVFAYLGISYDDFDVLYKDGGDVVTRYESVIPQPTAQEVTDTAASQAFIDWEAENGGDPTLTARRGAKEVAAETGSSGMEMRALIEVFNKRDNYLTNRITELQQHITLLQSTISNGVGDTSVLRSDVGALDLSTLATATRPRADAVTAYETEISNGNVDT